MFKKVDSGFKDRVYDFVSKIPKGRLVTYGQVAEMCGVKGAAYQVGQIAHTGPTQLPWQRVVNAKGGLARGYPGGMYGHRKALEADGYHVSESFVVDIDTLRWNV
jgi:methylated-DNA-protein-cysteine methyltransferase-like protein